MKKTFLILGIIFFLWIGTRYLYEYFLFQRNILEVCNQSSFEIQYFFVSWQQKNIHLLPWKCQNVHTSFLKGIHTFEYVVKKNNTFYKWTYDFNFLRTSYFQKNTTKLILKDFIFVNTNALWDFSSILKK